MVVLKKEVKNLLKEKFTVCIGELFIRLMADLFKVVQIIQQI